MAVSEAKHLAAAEAKVSLQACSSCIACSDNAAA
jgi:hypothetical protein